MYLQSILTHQTMNLTMSPLDASFSIEDYYIVCLLSGIITTIAIVISIIILIIVWRTKPRLHTVRYLLICNTCIASSLYCIVQTMNYIFLIFIRSDKSNISCRWRGYFAYLSICAVTYSYLIQAISRFFSSVLSQKYRWLTTFKTHYVLIIIQWFSVIIMPLPAIVTEDISYRPTSLCWVPLKYLIHVVYTFFMYYILPTLLTFMVYISIYFQVRKMTNRFENLVGINISKKYDLEILRNIVILLCIYLLGGTPSILFLITANKVIYLLSIVSISLAVAIEKICMSILDQDICQIIKRLMCSSDRVVPINA